MTPSWGDDNTFDYLSLSMSSKWDFNVKLLSLFLTSLQMKCTS